MSKIVETLTENIVERDLQKEGAALLTKWEKTGLLEGLDSEFNKNGMARLLENQAKELLREASTMTNGDVEGFAAVAFPIVRRVFGGLIANDLVSVQPMSLPSGLIFFLDFTFNDPWPGAQHAGIESGESVYGGNVVGHQITGGVDLGDQADTSEGAEDGFYALNNGYASPTGSVTLALTVVASGTVGSGLGDDIDGNVVAASLGASGVTTSLSKLCQYDPDLQDRIAVVCTAPGVAGLNDIFNRNDLITLTVSSSTEDSATGGQLSQQSGSQVRRLTTLAGKIAATKNFAPNKLNMGSTTDTSIVLVFESTASSAGGVVDTAGHTDSSHAHLLKTALQEGAGGKVFKFARRDTMAAGIGLGSLTGDLLGLEGATTGEGGEDINSESGMDIAEINIKVDSVAVTATTKKLRAKWSPELGQDLNAYHNLDAEVELTSILSEQIALEIDREILNDLIKGASAGRYYWSRRPGKFVNRTTGADISSATAPPDFTGTVSEWYETLIETVNDVSAQIHRKTLRGGANFIVCSPEVANIMEFTAGFRATVTADADKGSAGALKVGALSNKFEVYVDPYFPRNVVLVGRKGNSFLESGYVYAPYVPLQVTPTIFGTEDFVPRKGVMTRYAKKMVRPDMYGVVVVQDLLS